MGDDEEEKTVVVTKVPNEKLGDRSPPAPAGYRFSLLSEGGVDVHPPTGLPYLWWPGQTNSPEFIAKEGPAMAYAAWLSDAIIKAGERGMAFALKFAFKRETVKVYLTPREREVLSMIGAGKATREIANALAVSVKTIETHRSRIKEKTGLQTNAELIRFGIRVVEGFVDLGEPAEQEPAA